MYQWTCPLAKVLMLWGGGIGTWFAFLFRWISNFCVVKQQQTGQMLSDSQGSLFVWKEISLWGWAGTIELCSGSSCWTSCGAWKAKGFTDGWLLSSELCLWECWPGHRYKFWCNLTGVGPGCSSHRITGWGKNPQQSLVIRLTKSSGMSLKSICFMIQSPAMQTHTHVSKQCWEVCKAMHEVMKLKEISVLSHSSKRASRDLCVCSNDWPWNWGTRKGSFRELRFHIYLPGLLNALMNSSGVSSLIPSGCWNCSCWTRSSTSCLISVMLLYPQLWNILFLVSIFSSVLLFCCLCPDICTAVSRF